MPCLDVLGVSSRAKALCEQSHSIRSDASKRKTAGWKKSEQSFSRASRNTQGSSLNLWRGTYSLSFIKGLQAAFENPDPWGHPRPSEHHSRVYLVQRKESSALTTHPSSFTLTLTSPAALFITLKGKEKRHLQFAVSIFYNEKSRCGSRGNTVLTIQTIDVSTIGNRSQPLPLLLLHPRYVWDRHTCTAYLLCFISRIISLHTEQMTLQMLKSTLSIKATWIQFILLHQIVTQMTSVTE